MMIQTMSTKCQYRPIISTTSASLPGILPRLIMPTSAINMMMPTVTSTPWKTVSVKKLEPNRVVVALGRGHGQHHRQRAHQQHERAGRGERDVVQLRR